MIFLMMTNTGEGTVLRREHNVQPKKDLWEIVMVPKIYNGKIREQEKLLEDLVSTWNNNLLPEKGWNVQSTACF